MPGARVRVHGLVTQPNLNARFGTVTTFREKSGRWGVRMDTKDDEIALKPQNMTSMDEADVLIVRIPKHHNVHTLELQPGGEDYNFIMQVVAEHGVSLSQTNVLAVANSDPAMRAEFRNHLKNLKMCIMYTNTGEKKGRAICLHPECMHVIKQAMVACTGCHQPRFCSSECEETDTHPCAGVPTSVVGDIGHRLSMSSLHREKDASRKHNKQDKELMMQLTGDESCDICACGMKKSICSKCKSHKLCPNLECRVNDPTHANKCTRKNSVITLEDVRILDFPDEAHFLHDVGGRLLKMGRTATMLYVKARLIKQTTGITEACMELCKQACDLRQEECQGWLDAKDYLGAATALNSAGIWTCEFIDVGVGLKFFQKAEKIAQDAPAKMQKTPNFLRVTEATKAYKQFAGHAVTETYLKMRLAEISVTSPAAGAQP